MKKLTAILLMLVLILCGCSSETNNDVDDNDNDNDNEQEQIYDKGKYIRLEKLEGVDAEYTVLAVSLFNEYEFADTEKYKDHRINEEEERTVLGGRVVKGSYVRTTYEWEAILPTYQYKDDNKTEFFITPEGDVVLFLAGDVDCKVDVSITKQECIDIAKELAAELINIEEYTVTAEYTDFYGIKQYDVIFTKYIGEVKTTDRLRLYFNGRGELAGYVCHMLGEIDSSERVDFDLNSSCAAVNNKLYALYKEKLDSYDEIKYRIDDVRYTILKTGERALIYDVAVNFISNNSRMGDVIQLVVTK